MSATAGEGWTVGRLLDWTREFFSKKRLESPRLDAEILLAHVLTCPRIQLYTNYEAEVGDADRSRFKEFVRRRSLHEPVAYLLGEREFYGLPFAVSRDVLIPRPESEFIVDAGVAFLNGKESPFFADVGVGSGCIAIALASEVPQASGVGYDVCRNALELAKRNADRNGVAERVRFEEADLLNGAGGSSFDLIVSNPPYVTEAEWDALSPDVRNWEPRLALVGGADGLDLYRKLIPRAAEALQPGGRLLLEIGSRQEEEVLGLLERVHEFASLPTTRDYGGHPRVVAAQKRH